ncbi:MAG TPA: TetR family transcriptional regulator [Streptosporangiaceae bacterium]|jgi:AcrR family transcriptional regulator
MAWDTEGTRRKLKEAATVEFAEHGPDGTTMARIAARAGINKERLYKYFGDKQSLFATVLTDELEKLAASVPPPEGGFADVSDFAGRTFDYHTAHPRLARLLLWEGLTGQPVADEENRTALYRRKARAYAAAQEDGIFDDAIDADHLAFLIIALAAWWSAVPQLAHMLTGATGAERAEHARRRATVIRAAERLALPHDAPAPRAPKKKGSAGRGSG